MPDVLTREQRRFNMSRIRGTDTTPELRVRRTLYSLGFRFRLHRRDLPGKPDIVLPKYRIAIFVHGCFWHRHGCKNGQPVPATRTQFWTKKFADTIARDRRNIALLKADSWNVLVIWECETKNDLTLQRRIYDIRDSISRLTRSC